MTATYMTGTRWQDVLGHRVELSDAPTGGAGTPGVWNTSLWDTGLWAALWAPPFHDVTPALLAWHSTTGAQGLDLAPGVGTVELELLDLDGALTPDGSTDWLLGRHVRGYVTPAGRAEAPAFYAVIDSAASGGTFAVPTVRLTAYDVRSVIGAGATATPVANAPQSAATRLAAIVAAAGLPPERAVIEADPTVLLADDTLELGDLLGRTVESAAGLAWADANGRIIYRNQDWIHGTSSTVTAYLYAGTPRSTPDEGVPVAQTSGDLDASQALSTVRNIVTYTNTAEPPATVTVTDTPSINRYGQRRREVDDLSCDLTLLTNLANRDLAMGKAPAMLVEAATVTVYDADTAAIAALGLAEVVVVGRNDPGVAEWELVGIVAGVELSLSPESAEIAVTVTTAAGLGGDDAVWDTALWDLNRWAGTLRTTKVAA